MNREAWSKKNYVSITKETERVYGPNWSTWQWDETAKEMHRREVRE